MSVRIPFPFALALSIGIHLVLLAPPWTPPGPPPPPPPLQVELPPRDEPPALASDLATETAPPRPPPASPTADRAAARPTQVTGRQLARAQAALTRHLFYPPEAVAAGLEGEVIVLLMLDGAGRVRSAEIARSSGHTLLDRAALEAAQRIGNLPGNPPQTLLPVRFQLQ